MKSEDVVYGPVISRRLGQSLGVNLTPLEIKVCNFNCGYCRVGVPSKGIITLEEYKRLGWTLQNLKDAITEKLKSCAEERTSVDYITLAGNGEPTLFPWFSLIVDHILIEKSKYLNKPMAIFTNATTIKEEGISESLKKINRVFCKLDAGDYNTFNKINFPLKTTYEEIIRNLMTLNNFELSIAVISNEDGRVSNYRSLKNPKFLENLDKMNFKRIFIYDIDISRTTIPIFNRKLDDRSRLEKLAEFLMKKTGKEVIVLWGPQTRDFNIPLYPHQLG
ncbi:MAG: radical SAM protein [Candidatus Nanoarchaeia archaeon]|nr:radical SAM protein [Candidatus Nanoarchaeia archaeon]